MSKDRTIELMLKGMVSELREEDRTKVLDAVAELRAWLKVAPDHRALALSVVVAELDAKL